MTTTFRTQPPNVSTSRKSDTGADPLSRQIDELQRISEDECKKELGGDSWHKEAIDLYQLNEGSSEVPSFRPRVQIPQLQVLTLNEATDLTDNNPRVIITNRQSGERDTGHEAGLMAHWNQQFWNNQIMLAEMWGLLGAIGYVQVGFDPLARNGGQVWAKMRDPGTTFPDPYATCDAEMAYLILEDRMYLDEVQRRWPDQGYKIKKPMTATGVTEAGAGQTGFQLPSGPMSVVSGVPSGLHAPNDGRVRVRHLFVRDGGTEKFVNANNKELFRPKYPNGRYVVECEGVILADGQNPTPLGMFPIASFISMPRLTGYFPPSAVRYSKSLQDLAQKLMTQIYENVVRMNNGIVVINDQSGIQLDNFGGMPAEVHMVSGNVQNPIQIIYPANQVSPQIVQFPQTLLDMQKMLQGFTPSRMGEPTQGNVAKDLYGMSIYESQKLTRMRGRLMAESVQRMSELAFYSMAKFYSTKRAFPIFQDDFPKMLCDWNPIEPQDIDSFDITLDPSSIRPVSATVLRQITPGLVQLGLLDPETALENMEIPDAKNIAKKLQNQQVLNALSNLQNRKR